ncbi:MAG: class I SAM-dependent methyltransferase [Chloroflexi bacterium]|nr:class I SAM-dependent methyltransferase [Chloroflexota bacterium]
MTDPISDPQGIERRQLRQVGQMENASVLEIGCGDGRMTWLYGYEAASIAGIDIDHDELQAALYDLPKDIPAPTLFAQAQAERLPFASASFDAAIFAWSY